MQFGVVGDVHGDFDALDRVLARHPDVAFWLSVGDVASADLRYPEPVAPLYWIQGNNEDFEYIRGTPGLQPGDGHRNLHFLPNGSRTAVGGVVVAGLGGTFAPTWYDTPAAELPYPGSAGVKARTAVAGPVVRPARPVRDDKRRHFVREQVEALAAMRNVDVLLTHEAPRPFFVEAGAGRRLDAGKTAINEVMVAMRPRLHFFGHHHRFSEATRDGVPSIGLDLVSHSYVLVEAQSFSYEKLDTP